jgi:hypothetical protein
VTVLTDSGVENVNCTADEFLVADCPGRSRPKPKPKSGIAGESRETNYRARKVQQAMIHSSVAVSETESTDWCD